MAVPCCPSRLFSAIPGIEPGENLRKAFINNFPFQLGRQLKRAHAALQFGTILPLICGICGSDAPTDRGFAASSAAQISAYNQARQRNFPERSAVSTDENTARPSVLLRTLLQTACTALQLFHLAIDISCTEAYFPVTLACSQRRAIQRDEGFTNRFRFLSSRASDLETDKVRAGYRANTSQAPQN
jgi:hypothetical protein